MPRQPSEPPLYALQYYRFEHGDDFFVFNTGGVGVRGAADRTMFHDEAYSAYKFKSFDKHIPELVERLITEP